MRLAPLPDPGLNRCFTLLVRDNQFLESARIIADASVSAICRCTFAGNREGRSMVNQTTLFQGPREQLAGVDPDSLAAGAD